MNKRRTLWPVIAAAILLAPVLYLLSFGPACWLASRVESLDPPVSLLYRPILEVSSRHQGGAIDRLLHGYADLGASQRPILRADRIYWSPRVSLEYIFSPYPPE